MAVSLLAAGALVTTSALAAVDRSVPPAPVRAIHAVAPHGPARSAAKRTAPVEVVGARRARAIAPPAPRTPAPETMGAPSSTSPRAVVAHAKPVAPPRRVVAPRPRPAVARSTRTSPNVASTAAAPALSAAAQSLLTHLNPSANIAPAPNYLSSGNCVQTANGWSCANPCVTSTMAWPTVDNSVACTAYLLEAIDAARAVEGIGPMVLPSNWYQLSASEQLFVVLDLERTARGLPPYAGINAVLSREAQSAAQAQSDPSRAPGFPLATDAQGYPALDGTWATGFSVLAADYAWMYNDGWGGSASSTSNVDCTSANSSGCWSHRDELLGQDPGFNPGVGLDCTTAEVGVGVAIVNGSGSFVDLIEAPARTAPPMTFTWAADVMPYLAP